MKDLNHMSPEELSVFATVIALEIAKGKNADDLNILGNFIVSIGGLLLTMAAQKQNLKNL